MPRWEAGIGVCLARDGVPRWGADIGECLARYAVQDEGLALVCVWLGTECRDGWLA